jgi:hypothetical protein
MSISRVHISDQTFVLAAGQDIPALKAQIVAASRPGGGFVDFTSVSRGLISVLISPHLPVRFETVEQSDEQPADGGPPLSVESIPDFDVDYFAEQFGP